MAESANGVDFGPFTVIEDDPARGFCYPALDFLDSKTFLLGYYSGGKEEGSCLIRTTIRKITLK